MFNQIDCIDCRIGMAIVGDETVDLTVTSPPYGNLFRYGGHKFGWQEFLEVAEQLWRVTKKGGVVCWVVRECLALDKGDKHGDRRNDPAINKVGGFTGETLKQALHYMELGFRFQEVIVLNKNGRTY